MKHYAYTHDGYYFTSAKLSELISEALRADEWLHAQVPREFLEEHLTAPCLESPRPSRCSWSSERQHGG